MIIWSSIFPDKTRIYAAALTGWDMNRQECVLLGKMRNYNKEDMDYGFDQSGKRSNQQHDG